MKLLYEIVRKLRPQELRQLRHTFKHASFEHEKVGKLFELVTQYEEQEEAFYSQRLYEKAPDNTFRVTKSRLKRMMENVLLSDKSLSSYRSKAINTRLQTRKKLLQGEVLLGRGANLAGRNLLQQVISIAKKYDLLEEEFQAEMLLYRSLNIRVGVKDYQKLTDRLLKINQLIADIDEARIRYYSIANLLINQTLKPAEKQEVRTTIDRLRELGERVNHPQIQNFYFLSEIYYRQIDNRHPEAIAFCHKYLRLIEENESLHTSQREAAIYVQLAQAHLRMRHLEEARLQGEKALGMFASDEINYLRSMELCFTAAFYAGDHAACEAYLEQAMAHPEFETAPSIAAEWHYFHACLLFRHQAYQQAYLKLNDTTPLLADKHGMNLSIRLLEIMLLYELGHADLMETKILNMRQFIKRTQKQESDSRPALLVRILMHWYKHSYDFDETLEAQNDVFAELRNLAGEHGTRGKALFELLPLEQWMEARDQASPPDH
jgi:hypothetical protein